MCALLLQERTQQPPCPCSAEGNWNAAQIEGGIELSLLKTERSGSEMDLGSIFLICCNDLFFLFFLFPNNED